MANSSIAKGNSRNSDFIQDFLRLESVGGILLIGTSILALICANTSSLSGLYQSFLDFLHIPVKLPVGGQEITKSWMLLIDEGLMAISFFLVGLELKREVVAGELSKPGSIILPGVGAIGGMLVPALIYVCFNHDNGYALKGWAIPAATDIAFALAILALLGSRVPLNIKVFLTSLAIIDDIGAIIIIAVFDHCKISLNALGVVVLCLPVLYLLHKRNIVRYSPYLFIGIIMWVAMLKSGVHATPAGIVVAAFIPMNDNKDNERCPLTELERDLHGLVAFFVMPLFAFVNAGVNLGDLGSEQLLDCVSIGIALGLVLGKPIGVFGFCWLAIKSGITRFPEGMDNTSLLGTAALCGVGFTTSLFIGFEVFPDFGKGATPSFDVHHGIIVGSIAAGLAGYLVLRWHLPNSPPTPARENQISD